MALTSGAYPWVVDQTVDIGQIDTITTGTFTITKTGVHAGMVGVCNIVSLNAGLAVANVVCTKDTITVHLLNTTAGNITPGEKTVRVVLL